MQRIQIVTHFFRRLPCLASPQKTLYYSTYHTIIVVLSSATQWMAGEMRMVLQILDIWIAISVPALQHTINDISTALVTSVLAAIGKFSSSPPAKEEKKAIWKSHSMEMHSIKMLAHDCYNFSFFSYVVVSLSYLPRRRRCYGIEGAFSGQEETLRSSLAFFYFIEPL